MFPQREWLRWAAAVFLIAGLSACAMNRNVRLGDQMAKAGNWDAAVFAYEEAAQKEPDNEEIKKLLKNAKKEAAAAHYVRGQRYQKDKQNFPAQEEYKRAMTLDPEREEYMLALNGMIKLNQAEDRYQVGLKFLRADKLADAEAEFRKALALDPAHEGARQGLSAVEEQKKIADVEGDLTLKSTQPVTLKFQNTRVKEIFQILSKLANINILFDKDVRDDPTSIFIQDAPFQQALNLVLNTNSLMMKKITDNTILIYPKTKQKMDQYQDLIIRTFYLSQVKSKDMVNLLRTVLDTRRIFVNEAVNSIVIRDTPDKIHLAEKVIEANDRRAAEVLLDIEVLEVNRNRSMKLGWNFNPTSVTAQIINPSGTASLTLQALKTLTESSYLFTLPSVVIDFLKSESDARTLANPKIRVINGKQGKVNIGDRVPILISTTSSTPTGVGIGGSTVAGGVTNSTSIEFKDTGIKVTVEPDIHLDNDVTLKLNLEVVSLGQLVDLGNGQRQFQFGNRNAETVLDVHDGETIVIGGLIRDEDRRTSTGIPGLGDVPVMGRLFSDEETSRVKQDVILTITPHIVRPLDIPGKELTTLWSGTEEAFSSKPLFREIGGAEGVGMDGIPPGVGLPIKPGGTPVGTPPPTPVPGQSPSPVPSPTPAQPTALSFSVQNTAMKVGEERWVWMRIGNATGVASFQANLMLDGNMFEFMTATPGEVVSRSAGSFTTGGSPLTGMVEIQASVGSGPPMFGPGVLAGVLIRARSPGVSNIVLGGQTIDTNGNVVQVMPTNARLTVLRE